MTWQLLTAARTLWQEARGQAEDEQRAIAAVIWNRLKSKRWGLSVASVCLWPYQFSGWRPSDPNYQASCSLPDTDPLLQKLLTIVTEMETAPSPIANACFYYSVSIPEPTWAKTMTFVKQVGKTRFYTDRPLGITTTP